MTTKTQPFVAEIEFVAGSVAKRGMYRATVLFPVPCFGFAVYKNKKDAAVAVKACDGVEICDGRIRVTCQTEKKGLGSPVPFE